MKPRLAQAQALAAGQLLFPALALIGCFFALPVLVGLLLSLTDFDIYSISSPQSARFVGLQNYRMLLEWPQLWQAMRNTLYFVLVGAPLSVLVSLGAALLLNSPGVRLRGLFRTVYFAPVVMPLVAIAIVWRYLYHPRYGLLNHGLESIGLPGVDWLGDPRWAMPAIILVSVWKNFGFNMIIFIAGLQTPLGSTRSLILLMYEEGFRWWRMGVASAIAVVLFVLTLAGTLLQLRLARRRA
jgi:multiple sugar transport system permease protein